jgi:putative tryptophan/tyrosine transport system substrate-binding protein
MRIGQTRLIVAVALGLFAWSVSADAQQPTRIPRVGILSDEIGLLPTFFEPFAQGMRDLGYVEGQGIAFERRYAERKNDLLPGLAAEIVGLQPEFILAVGTPAALAAKAATQTIPIVFARIADPVGAGLVPSLARPGGNLTGVSVLTVEQGAKRLDLLIMAVPDAKRVGTLWNPSAPPDSPQLRETERAARSLSVEIIPAEVRGPDDFEPALQAVVDQRVDALIMMGGAVFGEHSQRIADLVANARLPSMFARREYVEAGGLMSYGANYPDMSRRAATYVDKILKGAKPADLPVEQPTKFELVINLNTAKALGLTLQFTLLARADEVIE